MVGLGQDCRGWDQFALVLCWLCSAARVNAARVCVVHGSACAWHSTAWGLFALSSWCASVCVGGNSENHVSVCHNPGARLSREDGFQR